MNKVILLGRLTKDMEITKKGDMTIARGTMAVDRRKKQGEESKADFINIVSFGKLADFFEKFGRKGTKFLAEGRIQTDSYEKDGKRIYTWAVIVDSAEFAESKASQGSSSPDPKPRDDGFMELPDGIDEELPFV